MLLLAQLYIRAVQTLAYDYNAKFIYMAGTGMESLTPVGLTCCVHPGPSKPLRRSSSAAPDPHCTPIKPFSARDFALGGSLAFLAGVSSVRRRCPHQRIPTVKMLGKLVASSKGWCPQCWWVTPRVLHA